MDTWKLAVIIQKFTIHLCPKHADGMANSVYPDQTASLDGLI